MKVRITTQHSGTFEAELGEGMTVEDLFGDKGTVSFSVTEGDSTTRVHMLRRLILVVEEEQVWEQVV